MTVKFFKKPNTFKLSSSLSRLFFVFSISLISFFSYSQLSYAQGYVFLNKESNLELSLSATPVQESRPVDLTIKFRQGYLNASQQNSVKRISVYAVKSGIECEPSGSNCAKITVSNSQFTGDSTTVQLLIPARTYGDPGPNKLLQVEAGGFTDRSETAYIRFETTPATPGTENNSITPVVYDDSPTVNISSQNSSSRLAKFIADVIISILGIINELLFQVYQLLIAPLLQSVLSIRTYTDAFADVIYPGWEYLRNLANIFYIVSLVFIGLATIFRLEGYNYKHLLVSLIISALLVNFSLVIAQAVLGLADTVQNTFLPNSLIVVRNLGHKLMVEPYYNLLLDPSRSEYGALSSVTQMFFLLAISFGSFFVFGAIAVMLLVRVVVLWVLLMLSPVPYFGSILPFTKSLVKDWWGYFIRYAFFTPIIAFFLRVTNLIVENNSRVMSVLVQPGNQAGTTVFSQGAQAAWFVDIALRIGSNVLLLIFLFMGMSVASKLNIIGGDYFEKWGRNAAMLPFNRAGKYTGKAAGAAYDRTRYGYQSMLFNRLGKSDNKFAQTAYALLRPGLFLEAKKIDFEKDKTNLEKQSKAAALKIKRQSIFGRRRSEDPLALANEHLGESFLEEEYGEYTGNEGVEVDRFEALYKEALAGGTQGERAKLMLPAQIKRLASGHHINEAVARYAKLAGLGDGIELNYNKENLIGVLNHMQEKGILTEAINEDFQKKLGKIGYAENDIVSAELTASENGKTLLIRTRLNENSKKFEVIGSDIYRELHDFADKEGLDAKAIEELAQGKGVHFSKFEAGLATKKMRFNVEDYKNAQRYESKIRESQENLIKEDSAKLYRQWHESIFTRDPKTGKVVLNNAGEKIFTTLDNNSLFLFQRGTMTKKVKEWFKGFLEDEGNMKEQIREAIKRDAHAQGEAISEADLNMKTDEAVYNTYLGAMASIGGMQPKEIEDKYQKSGGKSGVPINLSDPTHKAEAEKHMQEMRKLLRLS